MSVAEQLAAVRTDLRANAERISQLASPITDDAFIRRPAGGGWSASECIAHLTLTTEGYIPLLAAARRSVPAGAPLPRSYGMGFAARTLWWILKPPARRFSVSRTLPEFVPNAAAPKAFTIAAFARSQDALLAWISSVASLPLDRMMITSPFNAKMRYNAYGALRVLAVHQQRHIWQAERAVKGVP